MRAASGKRLGSLLLRRQAESQSLASLAARVSHDTDKTKGGQEMTGGSAAKRKGSAFEAFALLMAVTS